MFPLAFHQRAAGSDATIPAAFSAWGFQRYQDAAPVASVWVC